MFDHSHIYFVLETNKTVKKYIVCMNSFRKFILGYRKPNIIFDKLPILKLSRNESVYCTVIL